MGKGYRLAFLKSRIKGKTKIIPLTTIFPLGTKKEAEFIKRRLLTKSVMKSLSKKGFKRPTIIVRKV